MLLTRLKLDYFGKFSGKELELKPGINLIYGENEAGKSTLHAFIKGILFGIERLRGGGEVKEDTYTRYLPWEYPVPMVDRWILRLIIKNTVCKEVSMLMTSHLSYLNLRLGENLS